MNMATAELVMGVRQMAILDASASGHIHKYTKPEKLLRGRERELKLILRTKVDKNAKTTRT